VELRALSEVYAMHLSLGPDGPDGKCRSDRDSQLQPHPYDRRRGAHRIIHDLQKPEPDRRIASVLQRAALVGDRAIPLTQTEIGTMACASRRQVNAALKRFVENGWVRASYRSITILNAEKLRRFATEDLEERRIKLCVVSKPEGRPFLGNVEDKVVMAVGSPPHSLEAIR
jgi:CRP/FNR family cyclic AMP-dependent transcriptional regulator